VRLFPERGFENSAIDQIAAEAGVSERTFFRYFSSKTSALWTEFETEVDAIRAAPASVPDSRLLAHAVSDTIPGLFNPF
jgi:TetR/AcrR family transcriptional regulator, regulator of mycofactocin system